MINILVSRNNDATVQGLLRGAPALRSLITPIRYDRLFARGATPLGTCVFTDFDLLTTFEVDAAARAAVAAAASGSRILNWPHLACERFEVLRRLERRGLNPILISRLDEGLAPRRFPAFIRCEDGSAGPDTGLLGNVAEYEAAVAQLRAAGKTLKRRVAVSFEAAPDDNGFYRKYGAMVIAGRVVPTHLLRSRDWNVKVANHVTHADGCAEELAYVRDNPHANELLRLARVCDLDYARIDYTIRDGRIIVFEMNTNPNFPDFSEKGERAERLPIVMQTLVEAFRAIDAPAKGRTARFHPVEGAGRGGPAVALARWYEDFPASLFNRQRWRNLLRRLPRMGRETC